MARYLLLSLDNNEEAEAFIQALERNGDESHVFFSVPKANDEWEFVQMRGTTFARGLYMKPTAFCSCSEVGPFTRGTKYGLWIHVKCGKPTKHWAAGDHWYAAMGKNLLPVTQQAPEWRGEGVAHHRFDAETQQFIHVETGEVWRGGAKTPEV